MSEKALLELVGKLKNLLPESIIITGHCLQYASVRGIDVSVALNYFLKTECEWQFSKEKGSEGKRVEAVKRLSKRRGLLGVFEVNAKTYLITVFKINTRKQKYSGLKSHER
ncbi:TPA: hypothetical protein HA244_01025 [Candidatus Micrarchaeota archaeon]|nr:hypothetical protein [Candidatus Micrarchaeota archaeon]